MLCPCSSVHLNYHHLIFSAAISTPIAHSLGPNSRGNAIDRPLTLQFNQPDTLQLAQDFHGERFHNDISAIERRYEGKCSAYRGYKLQEENLYFDVLIKPVNMCTSL